MVSDQTLYLVIGLGRLMILLTGLIHRFVLPVCFASLVLIATRRNTFYAAVITVDG